MDAVLLARIQFAVTIGFHFIFPPISIGLAWLLVVMEWMGWRRGDETWSRMGRFFGKLLALTFAVGVATGITMEFQFGTNWAEYSKYVGDIFGAPLAAEGVLAFFLESGFLGLYLFGRGRVSKGAHWFSILMVAVGATVSAFWIIVANSWQQTPAGFAVRNGRAELESFSAAVLNPSTLPRFFHTVDAALIAGAFVVAGVAAWLLLKGRESDMAKRALALALAVGFAASLVELFPLGDWHAKQVARTQPEKFAAQEGLYVGQARAPLVLFGIPATDPPRLVASLEAPGLLSWMAFGDVNAHVRGVDEFPPENLPPLRLTFLAFHSMVGLGMLFIALTGWGVAQLLLGKLGERRIYLMILVAAMPLPVVACQLGWIAAEVGRQPWIVYGLLRTSDAASRAVTAGQIVASIVLFSLVYLALGALWVFLMAREVKHGPEPARA